MNVSALPVFIEFELKAGFYLGWLTAAYYISEAIFRPPLGMLTDRFGRKPFLVFAPALGVFTALATIKVHSVPPLLALRVLDGIAAAALWTAAYAAMSDATPENRRATAMSIINVSYMTGLAIGPLAGGLVDDLTVNRLRPFAASFYLAACLFVMASLIALFCKERRPLNCDNPSSETAEVHRLSAFVYTLRIVPEMIATVVITFLAIGMIAPIAKLFAMQELGLSETHFGAMLAPAAAVLGLMAVPLGRLSDHWGHARSVKVGVTLAAFCMWTIVFSRHLVTAGGAAAVMGLGFVIGVPAYLAIISERADECRRGEVIGSAGMAQSLAAVIGVLAGNHIYHMASSALGPLQITGHRAPFVFASVLLTLAAVICLLFVKDKPKTS